MHRTGTTYYSNAMQVRKIDCKLTRRRNQKFISTEEVDFTSVFYLIFFLKMWKEQQKELESDNQDNSNNMSREPLRFSSPSLTPYANPPPRPPPPPPKRPGTRRTPRSPRVFGPLLLRYAGAHADPVCVCVPVSVGLCVSFGSHVF